LHLKIFQTINIIITRCLRNSSYTYSNGQFLAQWSNKLSKKFNKNTFWTLSPIWTSQQKKSRCCCCSMQMSPSVSSSCGSSVFVDAAKVIHKQCLLLGNCDFKYRITVLTRARFGFVKSHQGKILNGPHPSNSVNSFVLIFLPAIILICVVPVWSDEEFFRPVQLAKNDWRTEGESVGRFYFEGEC
jgi:hypothetical protein